MPKLNVINALVIIVLFSLSAHSISKGSTGGQILEIIPDARTSAMGETFCGIADDANTLYYNPAGLASIRWIEIPISNNSWLQGVNYQSISVAYSLRDIRSINVSDLGTLAIGMSELNSGDITGRDINGNQTDVFRSQDSLITVSYAKTLFNDNFANRIMAGLSTKFLVEEMNNEKFNNMVFDAGALCELPLLHLSLGLAIQNIGSKAKYSGESYDLPLNVRAGASYKLLNNALLLGLDIIQPNYAGLRFNIGAEYNLMKTIAFRLGYKPWVDEGLGLSTGIGISLKQLDVLFTYANEVNLDYAFMPYGDLGETHRISLNFKLGAE